MYVRVSGRALLNVHSANAEGAVGAYIGLSRMSIVRRKEGAIEVTEEPVISGNMLKHWHALALIPLLESQGSSSICDLCKQRVMFRSPHNLASEFEYVKACAIEDLHGFLDPRSNIRRESLVKFSFMIPVEEHEASVSAITHNRVVLTPQGKVPTRKEARELWGREEAAAMMVFKREHASGLYGFVCSMDLAYVGRSTQSPSLVVSREERKDRARAAILALTHVISGQMGAAQARALAAMKTTELICIASKNPIPNATHGFYNDYAENTAYMLRSLSRSSIISIENTKVAVTEGRIHNTMLQAGVPDEMVVPTKSAEEAAISIAELVDKWLS